MLEINKNDDDETRNPSVTEVFLRYKHSLRKLVSRFVRPCDIEDVVQETYVRAYQNSLTYEIEYPKTYLYTAARNLALNYSSKKHLELEELVGDYEAQEVYEGSVVEKTVESQEKLLLFCRSVEGLPDKCKRVFIMKRVYGLSQKEIAEKLGISERTVEGHIAKGAVRCARYLREQGYSVGNDMKVSGRQEKVNGASE